MSKSIAERIEALEGPCREMDLSIAKAVGLAHLDAVAGGVTGFMYMDRGQPACVTVPRYTASLDAAMTLVPERWVWSINQFPDKASAYCVSEDEVIARPRKQYQATPALALCAAALRAQEAHNG